MTLEELELWDYRVHPKDNLWPYRRQWVALRGGRVIASSASGVELRRRPEVAPGDVLMPVPPRGTAVLVLDDA